ncbi:hypothetical protein K227x_53310 [Rubripirellula lacrimiformis]|uniref:Uncharacterized protein n=1 Tax=Rubripirellula lacrimiformis TaxID=1930273 RepID=A0A517NIJ9_9BACT|nr:hypothetical protein K227x_53310 [Rubripirellula lacrimiformis]
MTISPPDIDERETGEMASQREIRIESDNLHSTIRIFSDALVQTKPYSIRVRQAKQKSTGWKSLTAFLTAFLQCR